MQSTVHAKTLKALPHDLEAEKAVLGAVLLDPDSLDRALEVLSPDGCEFYLKAHRVIFTAMSDLRFKGEPVDLVVLTGRLKDHRDMAQVRGVSYLAELLEMVATAANIRYYAKRVKSMALRRWLIAEALEIAREAQEDDDAYNLLERAQRRLNRAEGGRADFVPMKNILVGVFEEIEKRAEGGGRISGLSTGLTDLDLYLGGLQRTDLVVVAGRPSMGKSSLCTQIATWLALNNHRVGYFSIEVGKGQLVKNIFANQTQIPTFKFRTGYIQPDEWGRLTATVGDLHETVFSIDDFSRSTQEISRQARRMKADHGLDIIFIDHIQELREKGRFNGRNEEIESAASNLKALAKELDIPVVVAAQLNRLVETREDKRPRLSDLRDCGAIEQIADVVVLLYREEYYKRDKSKGIAEAIIAKQRNGATGDVKLTWRGEYLRFDDYTAIGG